jgi:hypothetical protein
MSRRVYHRVKPSFDLSVTGCGKIAEHLFAGTATNEEAAYKCATMKYKPCRRCYPGMPSDTRAGFPGWEKAVMDTALASGVFEPGVVSVDGLPYGFTRVHMRNGMNSPKGIAFHRFTYIVWPSGKVTG